MWGANDDLSCSKRLRVRLSYEHQPAYWSQRGKCLPLHPIRYAQGFFILELEPSAYFQEINSPNTKFPKKIVGKFCDSFFFYANPQLRTVFVKIFKNKFITRRIWFSFCRLVRVSSIYFQSDEKEENVIHSKLEFNFLLFVW